MTEIDMNNLSICDSLGFWWTYHPNQYQFGSDRIVMNDDHSVGGGSGCVGFRDAVETLLEGGYLDEEIVEAWLEAN